MSSWILAPVVVYEEIVRKLAVRVATAQQDITASVGFRHVRLDLSELLHKLVQAVVLGEGHLTVADGTH